MTTKLEKSLKREIDVDGKAYTLTIDQSGLKLVEKGHRNGQELSWKAIVIGNGATSIAPSTSGSR